MSRERDDLISRRALLEDLSTHYQEFWTSFHQAFYRVEQFPAVTSYEETAE